MALMFLISDSKSRTHNPADRNPKKSTEACGKCFDGCTRAKNEKNWPSSAPAYSTREKPSRLVNTHPKVAHRINPETSSPALRPWKRSIKSDTTVDDFAASRHGNTATTLMLVSM